MKISKKEEYAVKIMVYLALVDMNQGRPAMGQELGISPHNAKKILVSLRRAGLVESLRGRNGGYELAVPPENIRIKQIFTAMQEPTCREEQKGEAFTEPEHTVLQEVESIYGVIRKHMDQPMQMSIQDFVDLTYRNLDVHGK